MDPLSPKTTRLFEKNRLAGHYSYVRPNELVPHFFSRGSYYLSRVGNSLTATRNSCLHRGNKLVVERMKLKPGEQLTCKLHGWCYENGRVVATPNFEQVTNRLVNMGQQQVRLANFSGFFFEEPSVQSYDAVQAFFDTLNVDLADYQFDQENVTFYQVNWLSIMEIYLSHLELQRRHRGMAAFLGQDFTSVSGREFVKLVRPFDPAVRPPGIGWSKFHEEVRRVGWDQQWGAIFGALFPGMMVEFFPHVMVVNQLVPLSNKMTASYIQVYYDSVARDDYDLQNAFTEAYAEKAQEAGVFQDILEDGRIGIDPDELHAAQYFMPTHPVLEDGVNQLMAWIMRN